MRVFACWDGDHIGREVGRAVMSDDVAAVRRVDQAINAGNELWRSFALRSDGTVIEIGGDEGRIELGAEHLTELPAIVQQYSETVGATVSVGVGMKLSESARALLVAKLRGGNQTVLWHPDMERELAAVAPKSESEKIADEYLSKGQPGGNEGAHAGFGGHHPPAAMHGQGDHEQGAVIKEMLENEAPPAAASSAESSFEDQLHGEASKQDQTDQQNTANDGYAKEQLKQQLVQILTMVKEKSPVIAQLQQVDPDAYKAVMALVQGVMALGKETLGEEPTSQPEQQKPPVKKSEGLEKAVSSIPTGPQKKPMSSNGPPPNSTVHHDKTYDYSHVLPEEARLAGMGMEVRHHAYTTPYKTERELIHASLTNEYGHPIGTVDGIVRPKGTPNLHSYDLNDKTTYEDTSLEPHSELDSRYRGRGLGSAMYEAVFAHAKNVAGIDVVHGGMHSAQADALHKRLAAKHGFDYNPAPHGDPEYPYGEYRYQLKSEIDGLNEDAYIGPGKGIVFGRSGEVSEYSGSPATKDAVGKSGGPFPGAPGHEHLNLPSGTQVNDRVKVRHADGSESWIEARSGQVQAQEADAPLYGAQSHPVPSRQPGGR